MPALPENDPHLSAANVLLRRAYLPCIVAQSAIKVLTSKTEKGMALSLSLTTD